jgi:hypothetical protein
MLYECTFSFYFGLHNISPLQMQKASPFPWRWLSGFVMGIIGIVLRLQWHAAFGRIDVRPPKQAACPCHRRLGIGLAGDGPNLQA